MKKRILPSGFWALFVGFSFLLFAPSANSGNPGGSVTRQKGQGAGAIATDQINQIRANQATGTINPKDVIKAQEQVKLHAAKSAGAATLNWIPVGPNNAAGKSRAVIFDNRDATNNTLYAGGVSGGIWKSDNLGLVWKEVNTASNEVLRVSCMVQLPSGTIYVGTGESYCSTVGEVGTGLYSSTDGTNFTLVPGTQPSPNNTTTDWAYISKLTCNTAGRLFAATNTGLKYSDDGNTWQTSVTGNAVDVVVGPDGTVLAAIDNAVYLAPLGDMSAIQNISAIATSGLPNVNVGWIQFAIAPSDANIMYASIAKSTGALYNVYRSTDRGVTWSVIFPGNSTYDPFDGNGCANNVIAVCPNNPDKVLLGGTNLWIGEKYDASYFSWEVITNGVYYPEAFPYYLPSFHHAYVFNPGNPNQIIVATDKGLSKGSIAPDNISFTPINLDFVVGRMNSVALSTYKDGAMGGGQSIGTQVVKGGNFLNEPMTGEQIWIDNGLGNDGGTGGQCAWSMINPSCVIMSQEGVNPPWRRTEDFGANASPTFLTTGTTITNTKVLVAPLYLYENFNDLNSFDSISYKAGLMTIPADSLLVLPSDNEKFPFRYVTPVEIPKGTTVNIQDVIQTRFFVSGTKSPVDGIFMTKDVLKFSVNPEWFCIASTPNTNPPVSCFDVSKDLNYLWAGTTGGYLYRVSNIANAHDSITADINSPGCIVKTSTFDTIQYPFLAGRYVTSVSVSADNQKVILTLGNYGNTNYVYYSTNALDSIPAFHLVQGDLPSMPVYCSLFEKDNQNKVIIGTDFGAYSSDNIGAAQPSWTAETTGSGNVPVTAIKQQTNPGIYYYRPENFGTIVMSTYGRGMFRDTTFRTVLGIDPGAVAANAYKTVRIEPNPFRDVINVDMTLDKASNVRVYVYDLTGKVVNSVTWSNVGAGEQTKSLNLSSLQAGTYIISVDYGTGKAYGKAVKTQ